MTSRNTGVFIGTDLRPDQAVLVNTDDWFHHANGQQYKGILGRPQVVEPAKLIGFNPKGSTDWMLRWEKVGKEIVVAGCRIHYAMTVDANIECPGNILDMRK